MLGRRSDERNQPLTFEEIENLLGVQPVQELLQATQHAYVTAHSLGDPILGQAALRQLLAAITASVLLTPSDISNVGIRTEEFFQQLVAIVKEAQKHNGNLSCLDAA